MMGIDNHQTPPPFRLSAYPHTKVVLLPVHHSLTNNYGRGHAIIPGHMEAMHGKISSIRIFPLNALGGKL